MSEERLKRYEKESMLYLMNLVSNIAWAKDDLKERLKMIPEGAERMETALEHFTKLLEDLIQTVPVNQCKNLKNIAEDYQMRSVPKAMPKQTNIIITKENAKVLIDSAQEGRCTSCILDGDECRKCDLEQALECITPMTEYRQTMCPYNMAGWEE